MSEQLPSEAPIEEYPNDIYVNILNQIKSGEGKLDDELINNLVGAQELTVEEATDLKNQLNQRKLEFETKNAKTDPLTGLGNRRYFDEIAPKARQDLLDADEKMVNPPKMLLLINIDLVLFKEINDTYGHAAGDEVLRTLSEAIKTHIRSQDVAARYGGDEFLILMNLNQNDNETPETVIQNLQEALAGLSIEKGDDKISFEVTIGYAVLPQSDRETTLEEFMKLADHSMYKAKNKG